MGWSSKLNMNLLSPKNRESNMRLPRRAEKTLSYDYHAHSGSLIWVLMCWLKLTVLMMR